MAADSLIGGTSVTDTLSQTTKDIINTVLADTHGPVQTTTTGGTTVVQGLGANNEVQGVLVEAHAPVVGTFSTGVFNANVDLPANIGLTFEGPSSVVSSAAANTYLAGLIAEALPSTSSDPVVIAERAALMNAVNILSQSQVDRVVRVINVTDSTANGSTPHDINIVSNNTASNHEIIAVNLSAVHNGNTLVLGNVSSAVIVGAGSVRVSGNAPSIVIGDNSNQLITGGTGADTLVGGGGSDTLVGGTGADKYGFNAAGQYRVENAQAADSLGFSLPGIINIDQLAALVTNVAVVNHNATYTFIGGSTITLVGITPDQITANLIHFTL